MIQFRDVSFSYGGQPVIENASFDIAENLGVGLGSRGNQADLQRKEIP